MLTHTGTARIETYRLILRKFEYTDGADMLKYWISDHNIQTLYCEPVYTTKQEVRSLLDQYISSYAGSDYYRWAIILKGTNKCIGQIAYFLVDSKNHFAEIEYCIGSLFQNKGFATEAARAVIRYGFEKIHLNKVCRHKSGNLASKKVILKCGLTHDGTLRDYFFEDGVYTDRLYYSVLRKEYHAAD